MKNPKIIVFGKPGAGKDTIGVTLAQRLEVPHISTGDMFREQIAGKTELGVRVKEIIAAGHLVGDDVTNDIVRVTLREHVGYVLNGYPRTQAQAEHLMHAIGHPDYVINLQVPDEVVMARLLNRGREGETKAIITERLKVYDTETAPVLEYLGFNSSFQIFDINGDSTIEATTQRVFVALGLEED